MQPLEGRDYIVETIAPRSQSSNVERALSVITASDLAGVDIPERAWLAPDIIPAYTVTMLSGDGATGKSLIALQLAVSVALGRPWLGFDVPKGKALFLTAEDEDDEIHRRLDAIRQHHGVGWEAMGQLSFESLAGEEAVLAKADGQSSMLRPTELWNIITNYVSRHRPTLLVLDTLADLFAGNENDKAQARQFISMLRGLAIKERVTILLLSHPSLSGMASGSGMSGTVAWNNSVRSRLYFERCLTRDGDKQTEDDPDLRVLSTKKANYGPTVGTWRVRWKQGVFIRADDDGVPGSFASMTAAVRAEHVFISMLTAYESQGRHVSSSPGTTFAPAIFARDAQAEGFTKVALAKAMNSLFAAGAIVNEVTGSPSRRRSKISLAPRKPSSDAR